MKHTILRTKNSNDYQAAIRTLTFVGHYIYGGDLFSDLGLKANWEAYQKERTKLGLPAATGCYNQK